MKLQKLKMLNNKKAESLATTRQGSIGFEWLFSVYTAQKNPEIREYVRIFYDLSERKNISVQNCKHPKMLNFG